MSTLTLTGAVSVNITPFADFQHVLSALPVPALANETILRRTCHTEVIHLMHNRVVRIMQIGEVPRDLIYTTTHDSDVVFGPGGGPIRRFSLS